MEQVEKEQLNSYNIFFSQISPLIDRFNDQAIRAEINQDAQVESSEPIQEIANSDLHQYVSKELLPENQREATRCAFQNLENLNEDEVLRLSEKSHSSLYTMLSQNYLDSFILTGIFKLVTVAVLFAAPFFLDSLTTSLKNKESTDLGPIYIQAGLLAFSLLFFSVCDSQYSYHIQKLSAKLTQYLRANLYAHALLKKAFTKSQALGTNLELNSLHADLNNLMTVDVSTIVNYLVSFHETWSLILKLIIGLSILYLKMKSVVFVGFGVTVVLMLINFAIAKSIGGIFERIMKCKDKRVSFTRDVLNGIRQIQLCNWQNTFFLKLLHLRSKELTYIKCEKYLDAFCVFFWASSSLALSAVTFLLYYQDHESFENVNVFTAIYLFEMLIGPLNALPWTISGLYMSKTSFERFNQFVHLPNIYKYHNKFDSTFSASILNISSSWPLQGAEKNKEGNGESFEEKIRQLTEDENRVIQNNKQSNSIKTSSTNINKERGSSSHQLLSKDPKQFKLKINSLQIPKGAFVVVQGSTSSGKTALLQTILSELNVAQLNDSSNSSLKIEGSIAYVSQNPWVFNSSLRDNILFFTPFDRKYYRACIFASCLYQDLQTQEDLDLMEVGVNGGKLSGGQQVRACLARAFYSKKETYLLDNVFSSVDIEVADHIFAFGLRSLLRDKTIILTSSVDQYSEYADFIIQINDNNEVNMFPNANRIDFNFNQHIDLNLVQISETPSIRKNILQKQPNQIQNIELVNQSAFINIPLDGNEGMEEFLEPRKKGEIDSGIIGYYIKSVGYFFCFVIIITLILMQFSQNYYYVWLKDYVNHQPIFLIENDFEKTLYCLCGFNLLVTLLRAFSFSAGNLLASQSIFLNLSSTVFFQKAEFFFKNSVGQILTRFSNDTAAVDYSISFNLNIFLKNVFTLIGCFAVIATQIPLSLIIILIIFIFYYFIQKKYRNSSRELKRLDSANFTALTSIINESSLGIKTIRAFQKESNLNSKFFKYLKNCNSSSILLSLAGTWLSIRLQLLSLLLAFSLIAYTCAQLHFGESLPFFIDANTLALCLVYSIEVTNVLRNLILSLTSTEIEFVALERINQLISQSNVLSAQTPPLPSKLAQSLKKLKNNFAVEFHDVFMSYEPSSEIGLKQQVFALKGLTLQLEKGKKYAIVGRTGSGKSSLFNCLMKLYDYQDGEVYAYGDNIRYLQSSDLSKMITIVPQRSFLFSGSVRENIDPMGDYSDLDIKQTFAKLYKNQTKVNDLDFEIEEEGKNLSEGEKQLLSLSRVILQNKPIVCLDETTSQLDSEYEKIVVQLLQQLQQKTTIFITHRTQLLHIFDEIIVISDGKVVEQGGFNQLITNPNSFLNKVIRE